MHCWWLLYCTCTEYFCACPTSIAEKSSVCMFLPKIWVPLLLKSEIMQNFALDVPCATDSLFCGWFRFTQGVWTSNGRLPKHLSWNGCSTQKMYNLGMQKKRSWFADWKIQYYVFYFIYSENEIDWSFCLHVSRSHGQQPEGVGSHTKFVVLVQVWTWKCREKIPPIGSMQHGIPSYVYSNIIPIFSVNARCFSWRRSWILYHPYDLYREAFSETNFLNKNTHFQKCINLQVT